MGCYIVPSTAFIIHKTIQRKNPSWRNAKHDNLSLLLAGGAIFGIVDHAWNGELLFGKEGLLLDLLLGAAITATIFLVWAAMLLAERMKLSATHKG